MKVRKEHLSHTTTAKTGFGKKKEQREGWRGKTATGNGNPQQPKTEKATLQNAREVRKKITEGANKKVT